MIALLTDLVREAAQAARSLVFNESCALCHQELPPPDNVPSSAPPLLLCPTCLENLPRLEPPFCQRCGEGFTGEVPEHFECRSCHGRLFAFDFARAAFHSRGGVRELVHRLKYDGELWLAPTLGRLMALCLRGPIADPRLREEPKWVLVPVPLHARRLREREFNQAEELAVGLAQATGLPLARALCRHRHTAQQALLNQTERLRNLRNSFSLRRSAALTLRDEAVLLIDDVLTTGSTAQKCAQLLRSEAGARRVAVLTLARG